MHAPKPTSPVADFAAIMKTSLVLVAFAAGLIAVQCAKLKENVLLDEIDNLLDTGKRHQGEGPDPIQRFQAIGALLEEVKGIIRQLGEIRTLLEDNGVQIPPGGPPVGAIFDLLEEVKQRTIDLRNIGSEDEVSPMT